jgi:DNA-binding IclR family transcriptional regulator
MPKASSSPPKASEIVQNGQPGSSTTVLRAISLLEALSAAPPQGMGVTELSREIGANRSTVYRILGALRPLGYVRDGAEPGTVSLGFRVVELGERILGQLDIRKIAGPHLRRLSEITEETSHLGVLDDTEIVYIDKAEPEKQATRLFSTPGKRVPLHSTAMGKAYLAAMDPAEAAALIDRIELTPRTEKTITDRDALEAELELIRQRGWSTDIGETEIWVHCAGAVVLGRDGRPAAALSTSAPEARIEVGHIEERIGPAVRETADRIGAELGHRL